MFWTKGNMLVILGLVLMMSVTVTHATQQLSGVIAESTTEEDDNSSEGLTHLQVSEEGKVISVPYDTFVRLENSETKESCELEFIVQHTEVTVGGIQVTGNLISVCVRDNLGEMKVIGSEQYCVQGIYATLCEGKIVVLVSTTKLDGDGMIYVYDPETKLFSEYAGNLCVENGSYSIENNRLGKNKMTGVLCCQDNQYQIVFDAFVLKGKSTIWAKRPIVVAATDEMKAESPFWTIAPGQIKLADYQYKDGCDWYKILGRTEEGIYVHGWFLVSDGKLVYQNAYLSEVFGDVETVQCYSIHTGASFGKTRVVRVEEHWNLPTDETGGESGETGKTFLERELPDNVRNVVYAQLDFNGESQNSVYLLQYETDRVYSKLYVQLMGEMIPVIAEDFEDNALPVTFFKLKWEYPDSDSEKPELVAVTDEECYIPNGESTLIIEGKVYRLKDVNKLVCQP